MPAPVTIPPPSLKTMPIAGRVALAMAGGACAKLLLSAIVPAAVLHEDVHGMGFALEVIGALYGIIVAFTIFVVWDQFNKVQTGVFDEASALEDLCRVGRFLSDDQSDDALRAAVAAYIAAATLDEKERLASGATCETADRCFAAVCDAVRGVRIRTENDTLVCGEMLRALERVSDARDARLAVSTTRIPRTLWQLIVFASCALFAGFLLLGIRSLPLAMLMVAAVAGVLAFLLSVVSDMDNPFDGAWNVSYRPLDAIRRRIGGN
jgi:hypothetical protein